MLKYIFQGKGLELGFEEKREISELKIRGFETNTLFIPSPSPRVL